MILERYHEDKIDIVEDWLEVEVREKTVSVVTSRLWLACLCAQGIGMDFALGQQLLCCSLRLFACS